MSCASYRHVRRALLCSYALLAGCGGPARGPIAPPIVALALEGECQQKLLGRAWTDDQEHNRLLSLCTEASSSAQRRGEEKLRRGDLDAAIPDWRLAVRLTLPYLVPVRQSRMRLGEVAARRADHEMAICLFAAALSTEVWCEPASGKPLAEVVKEVGCDSPFACGSYRHEGEGRRDELDEEALQRLGEELCQRPRAGGPPLPVIIPASCAGATAAQP